MIRFLAISAGGIEAGLAKVSPHLDMAAPARLPPAKLLLTITCADRAGDRRRGGAGLRRREKELPATLLCSRSLHHARHRALRRGEALGTYEDGAVAALAIVRSGWCRSLCWQESMRA